MERLLYESKGVSKMKNHFKRQEWLARILIILVGGLWLFCYFFVHMFLKMATILVLVSIVVVFFIKRQCVNDSKLCDKAQLKIYEDHMEGTVIKPFEEFSLTYEEVYDVQKVEMLVPSLVIKTSNKNFVVYVNDIDRAYAIIDKKMAELEQI